MARPYPELVDSVPRIQTVVREEEEQFLRNVENGLKLLNDAFRKTKAAGSDVDPRRGGVRPPPDPRHPDRDHREPGRRPEPARSTGRASRRRGSGTRKSPEGPTEAAAVFTAGPLDALKKSYHHGNEFLGYTDDLGRRQGDRDRRAEPAGRLGAPARARTMARTRRSSWSSTGPRSTARAAARSATPGSSGAKGSPSRCSTRRRKTTSPSTSAR